jgi:hypothetical protein
MNLYSTVVSLHVVTAILGLGPLTVLAVVTALRPPAPAPLGLIGSLLRIVGWSLLGMFVSGAALIALTHGVLGETGWMRVSFALFLVLGFLHGQVRRQLRRAQQAPSPAVLAKSLPRMLWAMCAMVATVTYLMEAKPF